MNGRQGWYRNRPKDVGNDKAFEPTENGKREHARRVATIEMAELLDNTHLFPSWWAGARKLAGPTLPNSA